MGSLLHDEIIVNFSAFDNQWPKDLDGARSALASSRKNFEQSYIRISSIQAWRISVVLGSVCEGAEAFFFEAQNDLLTSHCLARCGSFRQSLKALRSAVENVYFALYYKDHPVELLKWEQGKHKLGYSELHSYFETHPLIAGKAIAGTSLNALKNEYGTLSQAVHGSAKTFRMTQNLTEVSLWKGDLPSVGKWATRERAVIVNINIILCHMFFNRVGLATNRSLREIVGLVLSKAQRDSIKSSVGVNLIGS